MLETDGERVGYAGTVVLRAGKSYDPDRVMKKVRTGLGSYIYIYIVLPIAFVVHCVSSFL